MSHSQPRDGLALLWQLANTDSEQLPAFQQAHFAGESAPTAAQLAGALQLLRELRLALETADQRRWVKLEATAISLRLSAKTSAAATAELPDRTAAPTTKQQGKPLPFRRLGWVDDQPRGKPLPIQCSPHLDAGATAPLKPGDRPCPLPFGRREFAPKTRREAPPEASEPLAPPAVVRSTEPPAGGAPRALAVPQTRQELTVTEYALLCATRELVPDRLLGELTRYGIESVEQMALVDEQWQARLRRSEQLRGEFEALHAEFQQWLAAQQ